MAIKTPFNKARFEMASHLGRVILYLRTKNALDAPLSSIWQQMTDDERFGVIQLKKELEIPLQEWERL